MRPERAGSDFEDLFERQCSRKGIAATRVPDGCRQVGRKVVRVKSPWDWVLSCRSGVVLLDTKTTIEAGFPHSKIDLNQIKSMLPHAGHGTLAGYVIQFRAAPFVTVFVHAADLHARSYRRGSIRSTDPDAIHIGTYTDFDPANVFNQAKLTRQNIRGRV